MGSQPNAQTLANSELAGAAWIICGKRRRLIFFGNLKLRRCHSPSFFAARRTWPWARREKSKASTPRCGQMSNLAVSLAAKLRLGALRPGAQNGPSYWGQLKRKWHLGADSAKATGRELDSANSDGPPPDAAAGASRPCRDASPKTTWPKGVRRGPDAERQTKTLASGHFELFATFWVTRKKSWLLIYVGNLRARSRHPPCRWGYVIHIQAYRPCA